MEPQMIKPTIGSKVWYYPVGRDHQDMMVYKSYDSGLEAPMTSTVVYVWGLRLVNVAVLDHSGGLHQRTSVPLLQGDDPKPPSAAYCRWCGTWPPHEQ
jgi:hypothetical protein